MNKLVPYLVAVLLASTVIKSCDMYQARQSAKYFYKIDKECKKEVLRNEDLHHEMCNFYGAYEYLNLCNPPNPWIDAYIEFSTYRCIQKKIPR